MRSTIAESLLDLEDLTECHPQARRELECLRKDAERYRWLRAQHWDTGRLAVVANPKESVKLGHDCPSLIRLDAAIDNEPTSDATRTAALVVARTPCPECGCAGCNGECAGDDMMGD